MTSGLSVAPIPPDPEASVSEAPEATRSTVPPPDVIAPVPLVVRDTSPPPLLSDPAP